MNFKVWLENQYPQVTNLKNAGPDGLYLTFDDGGKFGPVASFSPYDKKGYYWAAQKKGNPTKAIVTVNRPEFGRQLAQKITTSANKPEEQQVPMRKIDTREHTLLWRGVAGEYKIPDNDDPPQAFGSRPSQAWQYAINVSKAAAKRGANLPPHMVQIRVPNAEKPQPSSNSGDIYDFSAEQVKKYGVRQLADSEIQQLLANEKNQLVSHAQQRIL